ncbi:hypothetical protein B5M10_08870 [Pluralibacter gergoviae]|nr:hypothetical protein [Pluralibacter gergoviae]KJM64554.1 hypothetical protein SS31_09800 [Pluralibacter gergoviae]OUR02258.1 hypothetical protein B5M10_08870 [Pluralibacter gergoviae]
MNIDTSRIAASVSQIKWALDMDFLKAVVLVVLTHIVAPLAVRYIETNFPQQCVYETRGDREENGNGRRRRGLGVP